MDAACFACGVPVSRAGLENVNAARACPSCAREARLVSGGALVNDLLRSPDGPPLEGSGLNALLNPVTVRGRRAWADFGPGGFIVFEESIPSADWFEFFAQHVEPYGTIGAFVAHLPPRRVSVAELVRGLEPGPQHALVSVVYRLALHFDWSEFVRGELATRGPLSSRDDVLGAMKAMHHHNPEDDLLDTLEPVDVTAWFGRLGRLVPAPTPAAFQERLADACTLFPPRPAAAPPSSSAPRPAPETNETPTYPVPLRGGKAAIMARVAVTVRWEGRARPCRVVLSWDGESVEATENDVYHAFQEVRLMLEGRQLTPDCYGSCPDVQVSGMQVDMGDGTYAYRMGAAKEKNGAYPVVNIFEREDGLTLGTVAAQRAFNDRMFNRARAQVAAAARPAWWRRFLDWMREP